MKRYVLLALLGIVISFGCIAQPAITYRLTMENPHEHYFYVEMQLDNFPGNTLDVKMPVWAPGSYLVREFSKNIDFVKVFDANKEIPVKKINKNTWRITTGGSKKILIKYKVYAYELSVRTSFLDDSHGYINGTSVFMYIDGKKNLSGKLEIVPYKKWSKISTALERLAPNTYFFKDYDELADSPIEIGNQDIFYFDAAGIRHEVAMYGIAEYNTEKLKKDMAAVVEACTAVFGDNPNKYYVFIIHNLTQGSGGLEHMSSTTLQVNRNTYTGSNYISFLSLVAHEYFHLWNVKRLRPNTLGPFDYDRENYTELLWVMEGFTSYYDELLLKRLGLYTESEYLRVLNGTISAMENQPGTRVQPVAESSFDAWIKGYRPNENSANTEISYYTKGHVLAALLDMEIISSSQAQKKLDDLMRYLYSEFYKKQKRGFNEKEFQQAAEKIAGKKLDKFFNEYVYNTTTIDYEYYFKPLGLELIRRPHEDINLNIKTRNDGGKLIITEVLRGGSAYEAGLNVNDEIIAVNNIRISGNSLQNILAQKKIGQEIEVLIARDNAIRNIRVKLLPSILTEFKITVPDANNVNAKKLRDFWLN